MSFLSITEVCLAGCISRYLWGDNNGPHSTPAHVMLELWVPAVYWSHYRTWSRLQLYSSTPLHSRQYCTVQSVQQFLSFIRILYIIHCIYLNISSPPHYFCLRIAKLKHIFRRSKILSPYVHDSISYFRLTYIYRINLMSNSIHYTL